MEMEQMSLISELNQGKQLANQLRSHLRPSSSSSSSSSQQKWVFLTEKIHSSFEKALSMLKWEDPEAKIESFSDLFGQRKNEECNNHNEKNKDHVFKKRKLLPRWTEEVKVCSGTGLEGPLNDGYNWRKYGQKDIHGATFPRCYYRCTHRNVQGCLATKQVQRSDNDPNIFEVTYRGRHTCSQSSLSGAVSVSISSQNEDIKENLQKQNPKDQIGFDFGEDLKVKSEGFDDVFPIPSFRFPSPSIGSEIADENVFYEPMMDSAFIGGGGRDGCFSAVVASPATSESNYFQAWDWSSGGGGIQRVQSSDQSELTEIISAPTSVTNSPIGGWDLSLENIDFDPNFSLDNLEFFS